MVEIVGWVLDLYPDTQEGIVLWLIGEDGRRYRLRHLFSSTFFVGGPPLRLRQLWRYLQAQSLPVQLERTEREDLFRGRCSLLAVRVADAAIQPRLFQQVVRRFPDLDYYDADVPLALRYGANWGVFPLAYCRARVDSGGWLKEIIPLEGRWELEPAPPPLRLLRLSPDVDPFHAPPTYLELYQRQEGFCLPLKDGRRLLITLQAVLKTWDPDLIITRWGDTWLFPYLLRLSQECGIPFDPNRDPGRPVLQRRERSYFTYGQVLYRGRQVHLYGRWHIDELNAMMYGDYGLEGVLEQARVSGMPLQEIARRSPGSGITAMQMETALRRGVLIPYQKQQVEGFKSGWDLICSDLGGLVYQPLIGLHAHVAEIDFISMYPSLMARFNISPETIEAAGPNARNGVEQEYLGLVPETLQPLLARRLALKERLAQMDPRDCRYQAYKARAAALKWLLVVCFGYLGYKNARFGRIEAHEAVTAAAREVLLQAKEVAEDLGFNVLHLYVDGLWVQKVGLCTAGDFQPLLEAIASRTHLPLALEGVYRWIAFLPSKGDQRLAVANRYFGVFQDGSLKMRGIEARRHDTPPFIALTQVEMLKRMAQASDLQALTACVPDLLSLLQERVAALRCRQVPLEQLLVTQTLSRDVEAYRLPSPAARAAAQLRAMGRNLRPGQRVRFLYTLGRPGVHAWDLPVAPEVAAIDVKRYLTLLLRAAASVLQPLGVEARDLPSRLEGGSSGNLLLWG